jgi:hypothetical protein
VLTVWDELSIALDLRLPLTGTGLTVVGVVASGLEAGIHVEARGYSPRQD